MKRYEFGMISLVLLGLLGGCSKNDTAKSDFGDVIVAAEKVKSYQFKETLYPKNHSPLTAEVFVKSPGVMRFEEENGRVSINDRNQKITLSIDPKEKKVVVMKIPAGVKNEESTSLAEDLRNIVSTSKKCEELGEKIVKNKKLTGFRFTHEKGVDTFWVDQQTKLPVEREIEQIVSDPFMPANEIVRRTNTDYSYTPPKDSLFSLTPPDDYAIEEKEYKSPVVSNEKEFLAGLKLWAEQNRNQFPDELTMLKLVSLKFRSDIKVSDETLKAIDAKVIGFARDQHKQKHAWRYWGKGVKLGDKEKMVYWYQPTPDKPYRVVYGDLSVREIEKDNLPTTQPTTQPVTK